MTPKLQAASLAALSGISHAFFTREGGVSEGIYASLNGGIGSNDHPDRVAENRARMASGVGVRPDRLLTAYQIHSPDVAVVAAPWTPDRRPRADALVTTEPGLAIAVTTADCGPILLADERAGVVAAAHAGWRGAAGGVIEATIAAMERYGADRERIVAAVGPMIRQPSYEGRPGIRGGLCGKTQPMRGSLRHRRATARAFDLPGYVAARLAAAGIRHIETPVTAPIPIRRVLQLSALTHRKESDYGRHISAIALAR
jgi:YfiH family protein